MSARRHLSEDLLWSVVFLDLGVIAAWAGKWWWFIVFLLFALGLMIKAVRQDGGDGEA
jgi:hypothetical protein